MERKVTLYKGRPEYNAVCTQKPKDIVRKMALNFPRNEMWKVALEKSLRVDIPNDLQCVNASSEEFNKFASLTYDDLKVLLTYIETLISSCQSWDK